MLRILTVITFAFLSVAAPAFAQTATGSVTVHVIDSGGAPLPGAQVTIRSTADGTTYARGAADFDGIATFTNIPANVGLVADTSFAGFNQDRHHFFLNDGERLGFEVSLRVGFAGN